jgi:hypothetical protein
MADNTAPLEQGVVSLAAALSRIRYRQFSLLQLLTGVSCAGVTIAAATASGWPAVFIPLTALATAITCRNRTGPDFWRQTICGVVLGTCLLVQAVACSFAYETVGEVRSGLMHASLILYLPFVVMYHLGLPMRAVAVSMLLLLVFATPQFAWARRHSLARMEVERIAAFAEATKRRMGHYPHDLTGYEWRNPSSREYIEYDVTAGGHLMVYFWSGNRNAPHWYSCTSGWGYYPD